jgi:hypothetical protein
MTVVWRTATEQGFELDLDHEGVILVVRQLKPVFKTSFKGTFTLSAPVRPASAFVAKAAAALGVSAGTSNPNPEPPGVVHESILLHEYKQGSGLRSYLAIASPRADESAERAEVCFNVGPRKGATLSKLAAKQTPLVVDFLARGLRDGPAWDAGIKAAASPRVALETFEQFFAALVGSDAEDAEACVLFEQLRTEPERFMAFVEPLLRELAAVRKTRQSLRRCGVLDLGRRALEELAPPAACAEFALQLDDADKKVRHDAVLGIHLGVILVKPFFSRPEVVPALTLALDTFVAKFLVHDSKQTLELAIEARRRLEPR